LTNAYGARKIMDSITLTDQLNEGCSDDDPTTAQRPERLGEPIPKIPRYPRRVHIDDFRPGRLNTCAFATAVVQKNEATGDYRCVVLPCKRWQCPPCAREKIRDLATWTKLAQPNKLLTLTVNPAIDDNPELAWIRTSPLFPELIRVLRKRFGKIEYLRVCEKTAKGWPHYHCMLRSDFLPQKVVASEWDRLTGAKIVDIREVKQFFNSFQYLVKYLTKLHRIDWTDRHVTYSRFFFPAGINAKTRDTEWRTTDRIQEPAYNWLDSEYHGQHLDELNAHVYALPSAPPPWIPPAERPAKLNPIAQHSWNW
jgi:hypothetical protein